MKKLILPMVIALALFGCNYGHDSQPDVSFKGLTNYSIEIQPCAQLMLSQIMSQSAADEMLKTAIVKSMESKGFCLSGNEKEAQFKIVASWNVTESNAPISPAYNITTQTSTGTLGVSPNSGVGMSLEIQAVLPTCQTQWSWRGMSPIAASPDTITQENINAQVEWCLKYFPPEKFEPRIDPVFKQLEIGQDAKVEEDTATCGNQAATKCQTANSCAAK